MRRFWEEEYVARWRGDPGRMLVAHFGLALLLLSIVTYLGNTGVLPGFYQWFYGS